MMTMYEYLDCAYDRLWSEESLDEAFSEMDNALYEMFQEDEGAFAEWAMANDVDITSESGYESLCQWCWDHEG